jgi:hypothetical protein
MDYYYKCESSPAPITTASNQIADRLRDAVNGIGTDESAIYIALKQLKTFDEFCSVTKSYERSYQANLFDDLYEDLDSENEWAQVMRIIRDLPNPKKVVPTTKKPTAPKQTIPSKPAPQRTTAPRVDSTKTTPSPQTARPTGGGAGAKFDEV